MTAGTTGRLGLAIAAVLMAGGALAQGPGGMGMGPGSGPGFGQHRPPFERAFGSQGDHRPQWWNNPKTVDRLKLTDDQRKAMDGILLDHREKLVDLRGTLEKAELEMEPLMNEDQPNETRILAQIDKVAQARAELEKGNARFLLAIRGKLTPDQWKQVQAFRANANGGREHHGAGPDGQGRGDGRGQGPGGWRQGGPRQGGMDHRQAPPAPPQPAPQGAAPQGSAAPGTGPGTGDVQ